MGTALVILVLVATGERADVSTRAVGPALEHAARRPVNIALQEVVARLDEAHLASLAAAGKADVVVEVGWRMPKHDHVTIQLHARDGHPLRTSELEFVDSAPRLERGRAVGFAIATMLADEPIAASILTATYVPAIPEEASAPESAAESTPRASAVSPPETVRAAPREPERLAPRAASGSRFAVEAAGLATIDARGEAVGGGPRARFQWNAREDLGLRIGAGAQWFTVGGQRASEIGVSAGILWTFARSPSLAAALRGEVGVVRDAFTENVKRTNPRGMALPAESVSRQELSPMALAGVEGDWRAGRAFAMVLALNLEASPRTLTASATAPSPVWLGMEGGVRISF